MTTLPKVRMVADVPIIQRWLSFAESPRTITNAESRILLVYDYPLRSAG